MGVRLLLLWNPYHPHRRVLWRWSNKAGRQMEALNGARLPLSFVRVGAIWNFIHSYGQSLHFLAIFHIARSQLGPSSLTRYKNSNRESVHLRASGFIHESCYVLRRGKLPCHGSTFCCDSLAIKIGMTLREGEGFLQSCLQCPCWSKVVSAGSSVLPLRPGVLLLPTHRRRWGNEGARPIVFVRPAIHKIKRRIHEMNKLTLTNTWLLSTLNML